ncbi:hypothetical protein [Streptomyces sp. NPDC001970]
MQPGPGAPRGLGAGDLNDKLSKAYSAVGHLAHNDAPDQEREQEAEAQD